MGRSCATADTRRFQPSPDSLTSTFKNLDWRSMIASRGSVARARCRSSAATRERDTVWMFGGLSEYSFGNVISYLDDFWRYRDGQWVSSRRMRATPSGCVTPVGALDTDRNVLVVVCSGQSVFEWDGAAWKSFTRPQPPRRPAGASPASSMTRR